MFQEEISIKTSKKREIIDIGFNINALIEKYRIDAGICAIFLKETTAGITTGSIDPKWDLEKLEDFELINTPIPQDGMPDSPIIPVDHKHIITHIPDHIIASLIGTSLIISIKDGTLSLGDLQGVLLIELNGPKTRTISVSFLT